MSAEPRASLARILALPVLGCLLAFVPLLPVFDLNLEPGWQSLTGFLLFMLALLLVVCQLSLSRGERDRSSSLVLILCACAFSLLPAFGLGHELLGIIYAALGLCLIALMVNILKRLRRLGWQELRARLMNEETDASPSPQPSSSTTLQRLNFRLPIPALSASAMMEEVMRLEQDPFDQEERILALLRQAAGRGLAEAQGLLAQKLKRRNLRDPEILHWLRLAAAQGDAMSCCLLAELLLDGQLVSQDIPRAMHLYEQAIEIDEAVLLPDPLKRLGDLHLDGQWLPRNFAKARRCYCLAAVRGSREAACRLGLMQLRDLEIAADPAAAARSFRQALDHPAGVYPIDRLAQDLVFDHAELQLPLKIAEELALAGGAGAARCLALSYTHGLWSPPDADLASSWMQLSRDLK